jgi:hypothetical protein
MNDFLKYYSITIVVLLLVGIHPVKILCGMLFILIGYIGYSIVSINNKDETP